MIDSKPIRFAVLRDRQQWHGVSLAGLVPVGDGSLSLSAIPGAPDGKSISLPGPFASEPSGIGVGRCNDVVVSDTANNQIIWQDGICSIRTLRLGSMEGSAPGEFSAPAGVLISDDSLYVADSNNARIEIFRLPTLELRAIWNGIFQRPTGLTVDSHGRLYVLDRGMQKVLRLDRSGAPDQSYDPAVTSPQFLAIDGQDTLYVSDAASNQVLRIDENASALDILPMPALSVQPRALAAQGSRIYVANADAGQILAFDANANTYLGTLDYRGPVAAMTIAPDDSLWIKPGLDGEFYKFAGQQMFTAQGSITTSAALDAGLETDWARVHVSSDIPAGTQAEMHLIASNDGNFSPGEADWAKTSALPLNALVPPINDSNHAKVGAKRFLWIRVLVTTENATVTPIIRQVEAETVSPGYLQYMPAVYRRTDASRGFLERWLKLMQGEVDDWERALEAIHLRFDPRMAPEEKLGWLATWLAFPVPTALAGKSLRDLFAKIPELYSRRCTPAGVCDMAELYAGVRPAVFEAFHARRIWQLGETSALGVETALPVALPDGMSTPGWRVADPGLMGLRGDYYEGTNFQTLRGTRVDSELDFSSVDAPAPLSTNKGISARWTGQLQPRSTDLYTFTIDSAQGVRLWVDGRLIIDGWQIPGKHNSVQIALQQDTWYSLVLEYFSVNGGALHLYWSSRNQPWEIVPKERLYSLRDEFAVLNNSAADPCPLRVGDTVVGESGPLEAEEYGAPLFSETAHLFSVVVPAAKLPTAARREALRVVLEREKPAHTDYHLCFVEARMRVGFQSRIGVDSIIAGPPPALSLEGTTLGLESFLGDDETGGRIGRVGAHGHIGYDTVIE